jgi:hypothetical protein
VRSILRLRHRHQRLIAQHGEVAGGDVGDDELMRVLTSP